MQIQMVPEDDGTILEGGQKRLAALRVRLLCQALGEVQVVPADDGVADQAVAARRHLLLDLLRVEELLVPAEADRVRESVRVLALVQLLLDRLAEVQQVDPLEQEQRLLDLAELL